MTDVARVQWCPNCAAWRPSALLSNSIIAGSALVSTPGSPECSFRQQVHACGTCQGQFTTINLADCRCSSPWAGSAELAKARKALAAASEGNGAQDETTSDDREPHPGLADFSPALLTD